MKTAEFNALKETLRHCLTTTDGLFVVTITKKGEGHGYSN
jgi:hypothetical protein